MSGKAFLSARGLNDPDTKPRAQLDKAALEIVELLGYSSLPQKMYSLVLDELEALTSIMEHGTGDAETYADRGPNVLRQSADKSQRSLDKWTE